MRRLRFLIPVFTVIRTVLNTSHRMIYPFLGVFQEGLGVSLPVISLALTARSLAGTFGPLLASIADSRGRKTGMLFGLTLFILGTGVVSLWPTFPVFVLAIVLATMGKYVFDPSMQALLGDRVPYQRRGLVVAITELGWSLAFILGVPVMGLLIARKGWAAPFPLLAILGLLAIITITLFLPKDAPPDHGSNKIADNFRSVFTHTPALLALTVVLFSAAANEVVNLVFGLWLEDSFGLKIAALGAASAVIGLSELSGESLVATLTDRLGKPRAVGFGLIINSLAALALPFLGSSLAGALVGLFLFYISFEFTLVSSIPMMTEILPGARATTMAANVAGHSLGRALAAVLATLIYTYASFPGIPLSGVQGNVLAAVIFNAIALFALSRLKRKNVA